MSDTFPLDPVITEHAELSQAVYDPSKQQVGDWTRLSDEGAVVLDPDELRRFYPDIDELKKKYPTDWANHTQNSTFKYNT